MGWLGAISHNVAREKNDKETKKNNIQESLLKSAHRWKIKIQIKTYFSCKRKYIVDTSRSGARKVMQPIKIMSRPCMHAMSVNMESASFSKMLWNGLYHGFLITSGRK